MSFLKKYCGNIRIKILRTELESATISNCSQDDSVKLRYKPCSFYFSDLKSRILDEKTETSFSESQKTGKFQRIHSQNRSEVSDMENNFLFDFCKLPCKLPSKNFDGGRKRQIYKALGE